MSERNYLPQFMDRGRNYSSTARKPPGGDTNDIFGLEQRQKMREVTIYEDKRKANAEAFDDKFQKKYYESEDILSPPIRSGSILRRSLSESRTKSDGPATKTPPVAIGKENVGSHFKKSLSPASKIRSEGKKLDESEDEDGDETSTLKSQEERSAIPNDLVSNSFVKSKLEDSTNVKKDGNTEPSRKTPRRPCIRVNQPPGGKSSIIF